MTALVTGGSGFIGGHVVDALLAAGERVRVLDLKPPLRRHAGRVEAIEGSVADENVVSRAMGGVADVFHMAGVAQLWVPDETTYQSAHVEGTRTVLRTALAADVARVLHLSSAMILVGADTPVGATVDGSHDPGEAALFGAYARSKWQAESCVLAADGGNGVASRAISLLPTLPMGPGDTAPTPPGRMVADLFHGRIPAFLDTRFNILDVRDLAQMVVAARHRARPGRRYLLSGYDLSAAEFLQAFERATGRPVPRRRVPGWAARLTARTCEVWACRTTGREPRAPVAGVEMALRRVRFENAENRQLLGGRLRPLAETLADSVAGL